MDIVALSQLADALLALKQFEHNLELEFRWISLGHSSLLTANGDDILNHVLEDDNLPHYLMVQLFGVSTHSNKSWVSSVRYDHAG